MLVFTLNRIDPGRASSVGDRLSAGLNLTPQKDGGWSPDRIIKLIKNLFGTHLNSRVVDIFLGTVAAHPIGKCIRMLSGPNKEFEGEVAEMDNT